MQIKSLTVRIGGLLLLAAWALGGLSPQTAHAEGANDVSPEAIAFVQVPSVPILIDRFQETSLGMMLKDPLLAPYFEEASSTIDSLTTPLEEILGLSWQQIVEIPQGELVLAVVPMEGKEPVLVGWIDCGEQAPRMRLLVEKGMEFLKQQNAGEAYSEPFGGSTLHVFAPRSGGSYVRQMEFSYLFRDSKLVFATQKDPLVKVLDLMDGRLPDTDAARTLSELSSFQTIMRRCHAYENDPPQLLAYADPIRIFEAFSARNPQLGLTLALLPVLGLDGISGVGLSHSMSTEDFDSETHLHLLLDTPRTGAVDVLSLSSGDATPEDWVPSEATSYVTYFLDTLTTYEKLRDVVDSFQGEGGFDGMIQTRLQSIDLGWQEEVLPLVGDRLSTAQVVFPAELEIPFPQVQIFGLHVRDTIKAQALLQRVIDSGAAGEFEKKNVGQFIYYQKERRNDQNLEEAIAADRELGLDPEQAEQRARNRERQFRMQNAFSLNLAVVGDQFLLSGHPYPMELALQTMAGFSKPLNDDLGFKIIARRVDRILGSRKPAVVAYERPDNTLKGVYQRFQMADFQEDMARNAEKNPYAQNWNETLQNYPLPSFEQFESYFAPSGGILTDEETGLHYMIFSLKRSTD
ncbi:Hypothetical protein PBC10988_29390 [Planctomycetales bacterium 10988]|nr:Hypothetical protein PBC10988_29390 [Planctomycetales bacterium 10988]